jgi:hypothetical protein
MTWAASILFILSYFLLGRKQFRLGWTLSLAGNLVYLHAAAFSLHRADFAALGGVFAAMAVYNLVKEFRCKKN